MLDTIPFFRKVNIRIPIKDILHFNGAIQNEFEFIFFAIISQDKLNLLIIFIEILLQERNDVLLKYACKCFNRRIIRQSPKEGMSNGVLPVKKIFNSLLPKSTFCAFRFLQSS